jgi:acyl-CoA reductase-like NAD-dependent aldehyde dehydrogenase
MSGKKRPVKKSAGTNKKVIGIITKEQQLNMVRRARRENDIESGINAASQGTGAWGGTKRQQRKREHRLALDEVKNLEQDRES